VNQCEAVSVDKTGENWFCPVIQIIMLFVVVGLASVPDSHTYSKPISSETTKVRGHPAFLAKTF
jgi:hypothetical protein